MCREQEILQRLAGLDVVPAVHGSFTLGEHHFLAMEFIDAHPLNSAVSARYLLILLEPDEGVIAEYTSWALGTQARIEQAVDAIHDRGVVIGDLHPSNVLLRPDGQVILIDFELAAGAEERCRGPLEIRASLRHRTLQASTSTAMRWPACAYTSSSR